MYGTTLEVEVVVVTAFIGEVSIFFPIAGHADAVRERFAGDPGTWLPRSRPCDPSGWLVTLATGDMLTSLEVVLGPCHADRKTTTSWRSLSWRIADEGRGTDRPPSLPEFTGEVGLYTSSDDASLVLSGTFGAVLGPGGASFDRERAGAAAVSFVEHVARSLGEVCAAA